jgi:two-component system, NarL family, response regulator
MTTLRIMIVDDHEVVREGLEAVIARQPDMTVVASVGNGQDALGALAQAAPDVVLLDLRMPQMDGMAVLEALRARQPQLKVLMLSAQTGDEAIFQALNRGAAGYVSKAAPSSDLVDGIRQAMRGRVKPSPDVAERLAERALREPLSGREIEVLRRVAHGESNREIGAALGLAENTVKNHIKNIMLKLEAADRTEAVTVALRRGIIGLDEEG